MELNFLKIKVSLLAIACIALVEPTASAQRPRFYTPASPVRAPNGRSVNYQQPANPNPGTAAGPPATTPPTSGQPVVIQGPTYDPYALQPGAGQAAPGQTPTGINPGMSGQSGVNVQVPGNPGAYPAPNSQPLYNTGPYVPITPGGAQSPNAPGAFAAPGTCFPPQYSTNGAGGQSGAWPNTRGAWPSQFWARLRSSGIYRLLERPRFRHTYIGAGDQITDLGIHDTELATTLTLPNFIWTAQPLRISPGFIFHFWDGPAFPTIDLPSRSFSTYFAFDYSTPWDRVVGGEVNFTIGVYSDFEEVTSDSLRLTGVGLGWYRITPTTTLKFGIEYLDRLDIKLFPAGGLFIQPTPDVKLNLYFPRPKIARRLPNLNNFEIWVYAAGEYGGGSWTIERAGGMGDQVDINDIRVFLGLEWMGPRQVTGFFEGGYVTERELVYRSIPGMKVPLSDSFMLRAGIAF